MEASSIVPAPAVAAPPDDTKARVVVAGRAFRCAGRSWFVKGLTYGPFEPNSRGEFLPERSQLLSDFADMRRLGCNALRLYHRPQLDLLDDALAHGMRVMVDVPWDKHRCFFEDYASQRDAVEEVRRTARDLGAHPGVLAISVANEIPHDIVRYYGAARVERFVENLIHEAKSEAPDCLVTYTNYPTTEFLSPRNLDFYCSNVYLHDGERFGAYLDRLQHVAGNLPLVLGEYGIDTLRNGEPHQREALEMHLREVFDRGLAGSFIFSYTDEWFTGGKRIEDWAFGITRADRSLKPAARAVSAAWARVPHLSPRDLPRVSVVVCSYNGAATLEECLASLTALEYPDYEVILVDDGSTDDTREIAARFPSVRYVYQPNSGLSAARNAGAEMAGGEIVAYTDSDCVAEPLWLLYLAQAMDEQQVTAIGGPNVPPASDHWTAKCVAASPGGPSHVMLDDRRAEHVPGCNMAFRRDQLLALGGFDTQFRQAGDDVDICWRFLDAGLAIGFSPAALVWHHRRTTLRAYWKQQAGYGRSEAMLQLKHPVRFNSLGYAHWSGVIYGDGAAPSAGSSATVFHGRFGSGLFQIIYRRNEYGAWAYFTLFEWHLLAVLMLLLSATRMSSSLAMIPAAMWVLTLVAATRAAVSARLPLGAPLWCRFVILAMHLAQPIARAWHRQLYWWRHAQPPAVAAVAPLSEEARPCAKRINRNTWDLYFASETGRGREQLLAALVSEARAMNWHGDFHAEWEPHDVELLGGMWHRVSVVTATEELGGPKRFTRARCELEMTTRAKIIVASLGGWLAVSFLSPRPFSLAAATAAFCAVGLTVFASRRRCRRAIVSLISRAAAVAKLEPARIEIPTRETVRPRAAGASTKVTSPADAPLAEEPQACLD